MRYTVDEYATGTEDITTDEVIETVETTDETTVADETVAADEVTSSGRRGRPRPDTVIERDNGVYNIVAASDEPMTRRQIAEITGLKESHVYLSLLRLRNNGRLQFKRANGGHFWSLAIVDPEIAVAPEVIEEIVDEAAATE